MKIKELGITKLERFNGAGIKPSKLHNFVGVDPVRLTELEKQYRELLEGFYNFAWEWYRYGYHESFTEDQAYEIIEKIIGCKMDLKTPL